MPRRSAITKSIRKHDLNGVDESYIESKRSKVVKHFPAINQNTFERQLLMIKEGFYLYCAKDFIWFFEFCKYLNSENPLDALVDVDLHLVGPFEVLLFDTDLQVVSGQWTNYYRYFHDPPELVTLILCPTGKYNLGYFRDSPDDEALFIAKSKPLVHGVIEYVAQNLFLTIENILKDSKSSAAKQLLKSLTEFTESHNITYDRSDTVFKERKKNCVCATMNNIGLFTRLNEDGIGYRPIPISYSKLCSELNAIVNSDTEALQLRKLSKVDELVTYVQFANDEGDFGEGLELGLSLLAFHPKNMSLDKANLFNRRIKHLLCVSYQLCNKSKFSTVIERHMSNRCLDPITFSKDLKS